MDIQGIPGAVTTQVPFTLYDIQACLYDQARVEYLRNAIFNVVRPGDVVIDAGSGTGLLGMFAAERGARVVCLEFNAEAVPIIRENVKRNGFAKQIEVLHADATQWVPPTPVDVIISEVISAGFFYEPQLQILNHLRQYLRPGGQAIPMQMRNYIELINAQDELYGLTFNYDTRYRALPGDTPMTNRAMYHSVAFHQDNPTDIFTRVRLRATGGGVANAVRISYDIAFAPGILATEPTEFLLNPQVVFLAEPETLKLAEDYNLFITYEAGASPLSARFAITQEW